MDYLGHPLTNQEGDTIVSEPLVPSVAGIQALTTANNDISYPVNLPASTAFVDQFPNLRVVGDVYPHATRQFGCDDLNGFGFVLADSGIYSISASVDITSDDSFPIGVTVSVGGVIQTNVKVVKLSVVGVFNTYALETLVDGSGEVKFVVQSIDGVAMGLNAYNFRLTVDKVGGERGPAGAQGPTGPPREVQCGVQSVLTSGNNETLVRPSSNVWTPLFPFSRGNANAYPNSMYVFGNVGQANFGFVVLEEGIYNARARAQIQGALGVTEISFTLGTNGFSQGPIKDVKVTDLGLFQEYRFDTYIFLPSGTLVGMLFMSPAAFPHNILTGDWHFQIERVGG